jgi:hypothetical protein
MTHFETSDQKLECEVLDMKSQTQGKMDFCKALTIFKRISHIKR